VKEGRAAEQGGLPLQGVAAGGKRVFARGERGNVLVAQRIVGTLPQMLGRLQFGGGGRQEDQMKALGDLDHGTGVLPRLVEHEHHALGGTRADRAGKGGQRHAHDRRGEGRGAWPRAAP
jgi:hypothetical protein